MRWQEKYTKSRSLLIVRIQFLFWILMSEWWLVVSSGLFMYFIFICFMYVGTLSAGTSGHQEVASDSCELPCRVLGIEPRTFKRARSALWAISLTNLLRILRGTVNDSALCIVTRLVDRQRWGDTQMTLNIFSHQWKKLKWQNNILRRPWSIYMSFLKDANKTFQGEMEQHKSDGIRG